MLDVKLLILQHAAAMWRRRWQAAAAAWTICTIGWIYVALLPDVYEAKTRIYVDTDSLLRPLMRGLAIDTNPLNEVDLMQRTLLSRPNLVRISRVTDQDLTARTTLEQEAVVTDLGRRISIANQGRNLFTIVYHGENPGVGKKVVEELLNILVETNLGISRKEMTSARSFVDEQIRDYERQLDDAEQRVARFKSDNVGLLGGDAGSSSRLELARAEHGRTQGELSETRQKRDELKRQLAAVPQFIEVVASELGGPLSGPPIGPPIGRSGDAELRVRVAELEQRLNTLRLRYTELHPDVMETKRLLEIAQGDSEAEQNQLETDPGADAGDRMVTSTISNPVYEQLKLQLIDEEARIAILKDRVERNAGEVRKWEEMAKSIPAVTAELARLTRDYDVLRRNYTELISRREAAKMGQEMETQTKNTQFRLIDPPEVLGKPIGPKRTLFLSMVFALGLGGGGAFAFFLGQIDNSIRHVEHLRTAMKLPVLGGISVIRSTWDRRWRTFATVAYGTACMALVVAYAGLMTIEFYLRRGA